MIATVSAFVLLGALAMTLQTEKIEIQRPVVAAADQSDLIEKAALPGNVLSKADANHPVGDLKGLGKSLFGDYLFAVELAGTLLLIASVGAIAIAPRREQGTL